MERYNVARKERRKAQEHQLITDQLKKSTSLVGSVLVVSSIAAPALLNPQVALATDEDGINSAQIDYTEDTSGTDASETTEPTSESSVEEDGVVILGDDTDETDTTDSSETPESEVALRAASLAEPIQMRSVSPSVFIAEIAGHARSVAAANDLYASVMMAQAILESSWGESTLAAAPNYNLFGIKGSYNGSSVTMATWEYFNGSWVQVNAAFRKYPSYSESFADNAYVLRNTSFQAGVYYYSGAWKSNTSSYRDATAWLTGRYATDPTYASKLNTIIESYQLTQYDTPASGGGNTTTDTGNQGGSDSGNTNTGNQGGTTDTTTDNSNNTTYTVQSGDSLWLIANKHGVSVADIKSWNNLSSDVIYPGQKLIVKKGSTSTDNSNNTGNQGGTTDNNTNQNNNNNNSNNNNGNSSSSTDTTYTVQSGDSLWLIANKHGVSIANLKAWNNLSSDVIHPGQKLIVKKGSGSSSNNNTGSNNTNQNNNNNTNNNNGSSSSSAVTYTVQSGDSLWLIANKHGVSVANLKAWNNLSSDVIHPGQKLIVKSGGSSSNSNTSGSNNNQNNTNTGGSTSNAAATYTVQSGDSLWLIANKHGVSIANLKSWNNLSSDVIHPGQKLIVKSGGTSNSGSNSSQSNSNSTNTNNSSSNAAATYTVQSGDSLWLIANKHGVSVANLKSWNNLSSDVIHPGQKLVVKSGGSSASSSNSGSSNQSSASNGQTHTVKSGDTLWGLANQYQTTIQKLKQLNSLASDVIYINQVLKVK